MFVYLDVGLLLSLRVSTKRSRICLLLGLTLGLGYLAKAILFPMAFVFMVVAWFVIGEWQKSGTSSLHNFPYFLRGSRAVGHLDV